MLGLVLACGIVGLAPLASWSASEPPDDPSDYLDDDGTLAHPLTLKVGQSGFAGLTGTLWTIEPSGLWTAAKFLDTGEGSPRLSEPHARGELDRRQRAELAEVLAAQEFTSLPDQVGDPPKVNPRLVTLSFGETTTTLALAPGADLATATAPPGIGEADRAIYDRFFAVARALNRCFDPR